MRTPSPEKDSLLRPTVHEKIVYQILKKEFFFASPFIYNNNIIRFLNASLKSSVQPLAVLQYCSYTAVLCSQFTQPRLRCHVTETLPVFDTLPPSLNTHTPDKKKLVTFICHCYSTLRRQADNKSKNLS